MASRLYPFGQSAIHAGDFALDTDVMMAFLIATGGVNGYAYNTAHSGMTSVSAVYRASHGTANLANKVISASGSAFIFSSDTIAIATASANATNSVFHALVICKSGANEGAHTLYAYMDLNAPVTANGGGVNVSHTGISYLWV